MREIAITMNSKSHAETHYFVTQANSAQNLIRFRDIMIPPDKRTPFNEKFVESSNAFKQISALKQIFKLNNEDILIAVVDGNLYDETNDEYFFYSSDEMPDFRDPIEKSGILSLYFLNPLSAFMSEGQHEWNLLSSSEQKLALSNLIIYLCLGLITVLLADTFCHEDMVGCVMDYCQTPFDVHMGLKNGFKFCDVCRRQIETSVEGLAILDIAKKIDQNPYRHEAIITSFTSRLALIKGRETRENIMRAISLLNIDNVDLGIFALSREFELTLRKYISKRSLTFHQYNIGKTFLSLKEMVDIVEDLGIIKDTATLTFLRVIRNERAHNKTPSVTERRIMMNSVVLIANLYIDNIQLFDELFYEL